MFFLTENGVMFSCWKTWRVGIWKLETVFDTFDEDLIMREVTFAVAEWEV